MKIRKILFKGIIIFTIFMLNAPSALAIDAEVINGVQLGKDMSGPLTDMLMGIVTERFGLNEKSIKDQAANANVYASKQDSPSVIVTFDNNSPRLGDKVTASAAPISFSNSSSSSMYFTWFLKRSRCDVTVDVFGVPKPKAIDPSGSNKSCDADGDNKISVNDWKVEAMRKIASNGFDWENKSYNVDEEGNPYSRDYFDTKADEHVFYNDDKGYGDCNDNMTCTGDAFFAPFGGTDNESFMFNSGLAIDTSDFARIAAAIDSLKDLGTYTSYMVYDGPLHVGDTNSADDCLGISSTNPDPIIVDPSDNCWGMDTDSDVLAWDDMTTVEQWQTMHKVYLDILEYNGVDDPATTLLNALGAVDWDTLIDFISSTPEEMTQKLIDYLNSMITDFYDNAVDNRPRCYIANPKTGKTFEMIDGTDNEIINQLAEKINFPNTLTDILNFTLFPGCKHYFPYMPEKVFFPNLGEKGLELDLGRNRLFGLPDYYDEQDGLFNLFQYDYAYSVRTGKVKKRAFDFNAERFWSTNPEDPSTAKNGNVDEANVVGVGQDTFTWDYQPGDQIGVIVEGISNYETKYDNNIKPTTWALTKNLCPKDVIEQWGTSTKNQSIKGQSVEIPTIKDVDLNECLPYNLTSPAERREAEQLEVKLSYTPENPMNDAGAGSMTGDELQIRASVTNARNSNHLKYYWDLTFSDEFNGEKYWPIQCLYRSNSKDNELASFYDSIRPTQYSGIKFDTMKLNLNVKPGIPEPDGYNDCPSNIVEPKFIKANVEVVENIPNALTSLVGIGGFTINEGRASITIPIVSIKEKLKVYSVKASDEPMPKLSPINEICKSRTIQQEDSCWKLENSDLPTDTEELKTLISECQNQATSDCLVAKDEIIAVEVANNTLPGEDEPAFSNFQWTMDGSSVTPLIIAKDPSADCAKLLKGEINNINEQKDIDECQSNGSNIAYFPITKGNGEKHTIQVAVEKSDNLDSRSTIDLYKVLTVADPTIQIISANKNAQQIFVGWYVDSNGNKWPSYDQTEFATKQGNSVTLLATSNVNLSSDDKNFFYSWYLDSNPLDLVRKNGTFSFTADSKATAGALGVNLGLTQGDITFKADKEIGEFYDISFGGVYKPSLATQRALLKYWKIPNSETSEKTITGSIHMEVRKPAETASIFNNKIIATLFTGFPLYLAFLFKIVLTIMLMLFSSWLLFNFVPNAKIREEKEYYS